MKKVLLNWYTNFPWLEHIRFSQQTPSSSTSYRKYKQKSSNRKNK
ncbi:hypothetical protein [Lysinibacillus sp. FJAT-14745]|nr:hypothetical protein [Lysinibacillus sp. FJAT-14745]